MNDLPPAIQAIGSDLQVRWRARRRVLLTAIGVQGVVLAALVALMGPRGDLLERAPWRLVLELLGWGIALAALPAAALGLWHPARATAAAVVVVGTLGFTLAALAPQWQLEFTALLDACAMVVAMASLVGFTALALAGGLARERSRAGAGWLAAAIAVTGFAAANWVCGRDAVAHVLLGHWGPASVVGMTVFVIARAARRR